MTHVPHNVTFTSDELALLLSLKNNEVTNLAYGRDDVHNSFLGAVRLFRELRLELRDKLPSRGTGDLVEVRMSKGEAELVMPRLHGLDTLINDIREWAAQELKETEGVLSELHKVLKAGLGISAGVSIKPPAKAA